MNTAFIVTISFIAFYFLDQSLLISFSNSVFPISLQLFALVITLWHAERIGIIWLITLIVASLLFHVAIPLLPILTITAIYFIGSRLVFTKQSSIASIAYLTLCTLAIGILSALSNTGVQFDSTVIIVTVITVTILAVFSSVIGPRLELMEKYG